jgi:hypothetical protein
MKLATLNEATPANGGSGLSVALPPPSTLWQSVDRLVDRAPRLSDLESHGLHLLAARRWRSLGLVVPASLRQAERRAALLELTVPVLLEQLRASCDGMLVLMKGPEVSARYPDPTLRPFRDLDLLVPDAQATQRRLLSAGFKQTGDPRLYVDIHHLRPLQWPGLPLIVEIHDRPKWIDGVESPPKEELFASAIPSAIGIEGIYALPPAAHALLLAAHSWAHVPLSKLVHVVDIAAVAQETNRRELEALAGRWGIRRLWQSTIDAADSLLYDGSRPLPLRTWARNLAAVRERTVIESHFESWLCPWWALPSRRALKQSGCALAAALQPEADESWGRKLRRTQHALRNAFVRRSDHDRLVEERGVEAPSMRGGR